MNTSTSNAPLPSVGFQQRRIIKRAVGWGMLAFLPLRLFVATREPVVTFPPVQMPVPNAYDVYVRASGQIVQKDKVNDSVTPSSAPSENARMVPLAEKQAVLQANRAALQTFQQGLRLDYREPPSRDDEALYPHFAPLRLMARLQVVQADVFFQQNQHVEGVQSCLDAVQLGQDIPRGGPLITRLVGIACQAIGRRPLWKHLNALNASSAKAGAKRMETVIDRHVPMADTWAEEKYFVQASLLKTFRDPNQMAQNFDKPDDVMSDNETKTHGPVAIAGVYMMYMVWSKKQIMSNYSSHMDALSRESRKPYAQAKEPDPPFDPITAQMAPVFTQARMKDTDSSEAQNALLCTSLALQAFRAEHKGASYPSALDELVTGGYLRRLPADPFLSNGNAPLRYRKTTGGMVLWSVGPDGKDDNGTPIDDKTKTGNARYYVTAKSRGDLVAGTNTF